MSLRSRTTLLATAALALAGLFATVPGTAVAQNGTACAFESPSTSLDHRVVDYDLRPSGFEFKSRSEDTTNTLQGSFDLATARVHMQVEGLEAATPARMTLEYASIVEFRDLDGDGRLGLGDEVVREVALPGKAGASIQAVPRMQAGAYESLARYPLNGTGLLSGVAELRFVVLADATTIAGEQRSPGRVFVEVAVESFSFARNDTRLAVKARQYGGTNLSAASDEVVSESPAGRLSYRWSRCVGRDGTMLPVGPVVVEYPSGAAPRTATVFAFPDGDRIEHASSLGLAPEPPEPQVFDVTALLPSGNAWIFAAATVGAAAMIVATAWRRVRGA